MQNLLQQISQQLGVVVGRNQLVKERQVLHQSLLQYVAQIIKLSLQLVSADRLKD